MKELIKITTNEEGKQLVSARELYIGLGMNKAVWSRWYKTNIENNDFFKENIDWIGVQHHVEGNSTKDFAITLEFAKHIAMMARTEKSHEYRNYLIECEKKVREVTRPQLPKDYLSALKALVESEEEKQRISLEKAKIEEEKNRLIHQGKLYTTTEIAKELGFKSAKAFNEFLKEKKIQYKVNNTWVLASRFSELGYTEIKQTELDTGKIIYNRKWTGTGRDWLINEVMKGEY